MHTALKAVRSQSWVGEDGPVPAPAAAMSQADGPGSGRGLDGETIFAVRNTSPGLTE